MNVIYDVDVHLLPHNTFAFAPILASRSSRKRRADHMPKTLNFK